MNSPTEDPDNPRQPRQMLLGWVALALFVAAVVFALLKVTPAGLTCVAAGGLVSVVALVMEYRHRQRVQRAVASGEDPVFPDRGTFGAPRSRQTHIGF